MNTQLIANGILFSVDFFAIMFIDVFQRIDVFQTEEFPSKLFKLPPQEHLINFKIFSGTKNQKLQSRYTQLQHQESSAVIVYTIFSFEMKPQFSTSHIPPLLFSPVQSSPLYRSYIAAFPSRLLECHFPSKSKQTKTFLEFMQTAAGVCITINYSPSPFFAWEWSADFWPGFMFWLLPILASNLGTTPTAWPKVSIANCKQHIEACNLACRTATPLSSHSPALFRRELVARR